MAGSKLMVPERLMPERSRASLRLQLQAATRSVKWTYGAFWQLSRKENVLVWGDGYYNGSIKTRKTVHARELTPEEFGLQRSQQLRDLYDTLSNTKSGHQYPRKPSSLNPEDLAETEWFFLVCMSCSFAEGVGLPGRAFAGRHYVWLCGANESSTKVFTRSLLAKTACIQTVVCIPLWDGVLELGTTEHAREDPALVQHVLLFLERPAPVSTSRIHNNSAFSREHLGHAPRNGQHGNIEDPRSPKRNKRSNLQTAEEGFAASTSLQNGSSSHVPRADVYNHSQRAGQHSKEEEVHASGDMLLLGLRQPTDFTRHFQGDPKERHGEDKSDEEPEEAPNGSAFVDWENGPTHLQNNHFPQKQWMLKLALFHITHLYGTRGEDSKEAESSLATMDNDREDKRCPGAGSCKPGGGPEEVNGSHVLAERRRREKLNDRFMTLRAVVPFVTKMDKASILGDAIEYVKELQRHIRELETQNKQLQEGTSNRPTGSNGNIGHPEEQPEIQRASRGHQESPSAEQERREELKVDEPHEVEDGKSTVRGHHHVNVSIEGDVALLTLRSPWRKTLLLDILQTLNDLQFEVFVAQASTESGSLTTSLKAKVKNDSSDPSPTLAEVEEALRLAAKGVASDRSSPGTSASSPE